MAIAKILCPTDFSPGSMQAMRAAVRIAREHHAELVLAHAWHLPASAYSIETVFPASAVQGMLDDAEHSLDEAVKEAAKAGAPRVSGKMLNGLPWLRISEELEHGYDLCVIGTHGRTGLARVLLGSVAEQVVRHAPCAVMAVRPGDEARPFQHALVPTDFSDAAKHALDLAAAMLAPSGSLTILHVIEVPIPFAGEIAIPDTTHELQRRANVALDAEVARAKARTDLAVTARHRIGYPGAEALAALEADGTIDLVAMGSHGRTGLARVLLGSVAEKVVRHARCPVLVAR